MHSYAEIDGVPSAADDTSADRPAARPVGLRPARSSRTTSRVRVPADAARASRRPTARPPASRSPPGSTSSCRAVHAYGEPLLEARRPRRGRARRSSTGRCGACSRRRPSSACSTRTGRPVVDAGPRTSTTTDSRDLALRLARESVVLLDNRAPRCRCGPGLGSRSSARSPTTRWRCSAATRSPRTSACTTRSTGSASRSRRSWTRCADLHDDDVTYARAAT